MLTGVRRVSRDHRQAWTTVAKYTAYFSADVYNNFTIFCLHSLHASVSCVYALRTTHTVIWYWFNPSFTIRKLSLNLVQIGR